ncbi:MAG: hypothetical protein RIA08_03875 [Roseovarius sp.]|uniref:hypothetical protein n=1 Tax=Roseovarius sp. TaxID=1486281 RepID=UPI0032EAE9DE
MTEAAQDTVETTMGRWRLDGADPAAILQRLPKMDRVMLALRPDNFMHERLGTVDSVTTGNGRIHITGPEQSADLPADAFASVVLDISTVMRDKLYPRLEFLDAADERIFSVTGLEGAAPMETALAGLPRTPLPTEPPAPRDTADPAEIDPTDPGLALLEQLQESARPVTITAELSGLTQNWQGTIEKIVPMGGYINVMTKGFHLHLAGGSVAGWKTDADGHRALDTNGAPTGLRVTPA